MLLANRFILSKGIHQGNQESHLPNPKLLSCKDHPKSKLCAGLAHLGGTSTETCAKCAAGLTFTHTFK